MNMNKSDKDTHYSEMQLIKRRFFAMRNGVIADALRKGGVTTPIIFGLNLPQIVEIAAMQDCRPELAEQLWADVRTRESRLLAPMVYPVELMSEEDAERWLVTAGNVETADIVCHRLLRRHPRAAQIAVKHAEDEDEMARYASRRLILNLLAVTPPGVGLDEIVELFAPFAANAEAETGVARGIARQLADEIAFIREE